MIFTYFEGPRTPELSYPSSRSTSIHFPLPGRRTLLTQFASSPIQLLSWDHRSILMSILVEQVSCAFVSVFFFSRTCDQFSYFYISGLPQQTNQGGNPAAVLQGHFILVVGLAVDQVPQSSAGASVNLAHPVVQQVHQQLDASLFADLNIKKLTCFSSCSMICDDKKCQRLRLTKTQSLVGICLVTFHQHHSFCLSD